MAEDVDIDPEFEDEDEFLDRMSSIPDPRQDDEEEEPNEYRMPTGQPDIEQDIEVQPNVPTFTGKKNDDKQRKRDIEKAIRRNERRLRQEQAEARRILREQDQDRRREQQLQAKESLRQSREQVKGARSDAISARVQSYSLAASIGFPGYVAASVVDSLFIRPQEDKRVRDQEQYQRDLEVYNESVRRDQLEEKRRQEQAIRNMPVNAVELDDQGKPVPNSARPSSAYQLPNQPPSPPPPPPPNSPGPGPQANPQPPNNPPGGQQTPPPNPPPPGGNLNPPPVPPTPPPPGGQQGLGMGGLGTAAIAITAAIQTAQYLNEAVDKVATSITKTTTSIIKGDASEGVRSGVQGIQSMVDPLGVNIPLNVAVQSFDALLEINRGILESVRKDIAFAPQSLQADISGDIQKLLQSIQIAQRLDPTTAELIRANTQFEMAWAEVRAKLIEELAPTIIVLLNILASQAKIASAGIDVAGGFLSGLNPTLAAALNALFAISKNTEPVVKDLDDSDIINQIDRFFDASRQQNKMRRNRQIPNP